MKKVLAILILVAISGFAGWQVSRLTQPANSSAPVTTTSPQQQPACESVRVSTSAPIVSMSKVDKKLADLGFGPVAKAHKIVVGK